MKEKTVVTKLPAGEIIKIEKLSDDTFAVTQKALMEEKATAEKSNPISKIIIPEIIFVQIDAESLSMDDDFMKYQPQTEMEVKTKDLIAEAIVFKVKNYYRSVMDPSFTINGIDYIAGVMPAVGKSYNWWKEMAEKYAPYRKSRLCTRREYGAFLGVLIKMLVAEGKSVEWAWNAVCNDSKELGHYWNSEDTNHRFEPTGSRPVCVFYDLVNAYKILAEDEETGGYWLAGAGYVDYSNDVPLAYICHITTMCDSREIGGVGLLVLS